MLLKTAWSWTLPQCLRRIPGRWWWRRQQPEEEERPQKEEEEEDGEEKSHNKEGEREERSLKKEEGREDETAEENEQKDRETSAGRLLRSLPWRRDTSVAPRGPEVEPLAEEFQICFNLSRHLFDLCVTSLLGLCSPLFRLGLDIAGLRGPLRLWLHGLAAFLVTAGGLHLLLCVLHSYLLHFACLYGLLQALVLAVSVRARGQGGGPREEVEEEDGEFALAPETPLGEEEEEPR